MDLESFNCLLPVEEKCFREAMTGLGCLFGTSSSIQQLKQKVQFAHGHKPKKVKTKVERV